MIFFSALQKLAIAIGLSISPKCERPDNSFEKGCWWEDGDGGGKVARGRWKFWSSPQLLTCCHPSQLLAAIQWSFLWSCHCPTFWLCAISKWLSFWAPDQCQASIVLVSCCPSFWFRALWPVSAVSQKWLESLVESMPIFDQVSRLQREKLLGSCCPAFVFEQSMHHTLLVAIPTTTKSGYIADMIFDKQLKRLAAKQVKHSTHATRRWRQYL